MARDFWGRSPRERVVNPLAQALLDECRRQEENCTYTALSFVIWLRCLRSVRNVCLTAPLVFGALATWKVLTQTAPLWGAIFALLTTLIPVVYRASKTDDMISQYTKIAGELTNLRDRFRQAATISVYKDTAAFENDSRPLFERLERARGPMLTPPEWCFKMARNKIKSGHYRHDYDES